MADQHVPRANKTLPGHGNTPSHEDTAARSKALNQKLDVALLPLLSLLYLFNGLDRGNVGNAETQGFTTDIGAKPDDLNEAVSLFFVTFVVLQPVSAAVGRYIGAKHWIPILMFGWGTVTVGQAFIKGRGALIATRLLIGAFEAGFYPTAVAYLSFFYPRYDFLCQTCPVLRAICHCWCLFWIHFIRHLPPQKWSSEELAVPFHYRRCTHLLLRCRRMAMAPQRPRLSLVPFSR
ncbi:hypothetical protein CEP52_014321 [Fusarium oligoseptatum]|uniref:Major facilitator superfamily transporter n=1 Tax=Fusarium oligoseptatum TaxID=2604345 RepID=A0A428SNA6_9HYPO|nr:hypothetical protein CEP52_014321 [Fusarium oligoseptatum]